MNMNVGPRVSSEISLPLDAARTTEPRRIEQQDGATASPPRVPVGDRVELSHAARTMAEATSLTDEQVNVIRAKISSGAYDDPRVIDVVARRILSRGDV